MSATRPRKRSAGGENGFSLIEAASALGIAVVMFVVLAQSLAVTVRLAHQNRLQQLATSIGIEQVEFARSLNYDELVMRDTVPGDTNLTAADELRADLFELPADEAIVLDPANPDAMIEPLVAETADDQLFEVHQYVTDVSPGLKRVVVEVRWTYTEHMRRHHTSTIISELRG